MQSALPKQFLEINGTPVLMHTIRAFHRYSPALKIIVVLPADHCNSWQHLTTQHQFTLPHTLVTGGESRFASVKNGLNAIGNDGLVAIHDGVRPLISRQLIEDCFAAAAKTGSGVAAVAPHDSLRELNGGNKSVDRQRYRLVQTPQTFKTSLIKAAYAAAGTADNVTDDASVAERYGHKITLVAGDYRNIKITTPGDLLIARALLDSVSAP